MSLSTSLECSASDKIMTLEELNLELKQLVGEEVSCKLIVCGTLAIHFFGDPRDPRVVSLWIASSWRYHQQGEIVVGSNDFNIKESAFKSAAGYRNTFERMCSLTDPLEGARLVECEVDLETSDLLMEFSGDQLVRSFAASAFAETAWTYSNPRTVTVEVSPSGVRLQPENE
jgi:hypothetical protein